MHEKNIPRGRAPKLYATCLQGRLRRVFLVSLPLSLTVRLALHRRRSASLLPLHPVFFPCPNLPTRSHQTVLHARAHIPFRGRVAVLCWEGGGGGVRNV